MKYCPYTCSDGYCSGPAGNEFCQDTSMYCITAKSQVWEIFLVNMEQCINLNILSFCGQGKCEFLSDEYLETIEKCHFTCTDGACDARGESDKCADNGWFCGKFKSEV